MNKIRLIKLNLYKMISLCACNIISKFVSIKKIREVQRMKTFIVIALFSSQLFSHVLFVSDPNNSEYGRVEAINEPDHQTEEYLNNEYSASNGFTMNANLKREDNLLQKTSSGVPNGYYLGQNSTDQFNSATNIYFSIPGKQHVRLVILNMLGQEILQLINNELTSGTYKLNFDAAGISSGLYVYKFEAGSFAESKKMMIVK